ncbi:hypothetical protein QFZ21_003044 [Microbacterium sp. W4I20]|nr:hypothetical protein [Microbacterium sp. W4I20]
MVTSGGDESADTRELGASLSAMIVMPEGPPPGTIAASTFSSRTSASASALSATSVTVKFGRADTTEAVSEVAATGVFSVAALLLAKPPITMPARASSSRMPVEIRKALLRSLDPISRSATSQTCEAWPAEPVEGRTGAGADWVPELVEGLTG